MSNDPDFQKKLDDALARNKKREEEPAAQRFKRKENTNVLGGAFKLGVELASGIIVGCGLGLLIDHYFDTSPLGIIVFFFLGCAAGMLNVYKSLQGLGYNVGYKSRATTLKDKNEDKENND